MSLPPGTNGSALPAESLRGWMGIEAFRPPGGPLVHTSHAQHLTWLETIGNRKRLLSNYVNSAIMEESVAVLLWEMENSLSLIVLRLVT